MSNFTNNDYSALLLRVSFGTILLAHGLLKIFVFTIPGTVGFFESLGLPAIAAYATIAGEIAGGIAIIIGAYTRLASLASIPLLIGATWAHAGNGWVFSNQGGGWEFPLFLVAVAAVLAIQGGGRIALKSLPAVDRFIPQPLKA